MKYIHYGNTEFRQDLFRRIENYYTKPQGGFWASPINAELGWKEWNDETHLKKCTKDNSTISNVTYICGMSVPPIMIKRIATRLIQTGIFKENNNGRSKKM